MWKKCAHLLASMVQCVDHALLVLFIELDVERLNQLVSSNHLISLDRGVPILEERKVPFSPPFGPPSPTGVYMSALTEP